MTCDTYGDQPSLLNPRYFNDELLLLYY